MTAPTAAFCLFWKKSKSGVHYHWTQISHYLSQSGVEGREENHKKPASEIVQHYKGCGNEPRKHGNSDGTNASQKPPNDDYLRALGIIPRIGCRFWLWLCLVVGDSRRHFYLIVFVFASILSNYNYCCTRFAVCVLFRFPVGYSLLLFCFWVGFSCGNSTGTISDHTSPLTREQFPKIVLLYRTDPLQ